MKSYNSLPQAIAILAKGKYRTLIFDIKEHQGNDRTQLTEIIIFTD